MDPAAIAHITPRRQTLYAGLEGLDDEDAVFESAERVADLLGPDPELDYLYGLAPAPGLTREAWVRRAQVSMSLEYLFRDLFPRAPARSVMFDPAACAQAMRRMSSPDGVLALTFHGGFVTLVAQLFRAFVERRAMIESRSRRASLSPNANDPGGALFGALRALVEGSAVYVTIDGLRGKRSGQLPVLGASRPVADGPPFLAYESGCETVWYAVRRSGRSFIPVAEPGPRRAPGETFAEFRARLLAFCGAKIEAHFTEDPESLVLLKQWRKWLQQVREERSVAFRHAESRPAEPVRP